MAEKIEVLKAPVKLEEQVMYVEAMKNLVTQKQMEFEAIQGKITQYKTTLMTIERRIAVMEAEHKAKLLAERQEFENTRQKRLNDLDNRDDSLQKGENDLTKRKISLDERELQNEKVNTLKNSLLNDKMKYEQLNHEAEVKIEKANSFYDEVVKKMDEAAKKENDANKNLTEAKNLLSISQQKEGKLVEKSQDIQKQIDNLATLRNEVNPKIEELKSLISKNEKILSEINKKEQETKNKIEEDNKLLSILDEKQRHLKAREIEIITKEQELWRREIIFKNK